jgi:shikimate kinase
MNPSRPIVIVGFMAAGKTDVARALAHKLSCEAVDLDQLIADETGRTPGEIIAEDGEPAFRKIESASLSRLLNSGGARVIALGGGAWTIKKNREQIKQRDGVAVWLDVPFETCWKRILRDGNERPLAPDKQQAESLYNRRRAEYALADHTIVCDDTLSAMQVAEAILAILRTD